MKSRVMAAAAILAVLGSGFIAGPAAVAQEATAPAFDVPIDGDYGPHLPPAVYKHDYAAKGDFLINMLHWFMFALFGGWAIFFVYCLVKFRARPGHRAVHEQVKAKVSKWVEIGVAVFEVIILLFLAIPVWGSVKTDFPTEAENPQRVRVVAEQFAWNFHYPGPDCVFGKTAPEHIDTATNPLGIDPSDPDGIDDLVSGELHIIVDRPVIAQTTSKDVIHGFSIPVLRVKQDAIPGMRIPVWFEAAKTGNYEVACAQLCGNNHYSMRALMVIHSSDSEFDEWLEKARPKEFDEDEFD